jgi:hypothetical protein
MFAAVPMLDDVDHVRADVIEAMGGTHFSLDVASAGRSAIDGGATTSLDPSVFRQAGVHRV